MSLKRNIFVRTYIFKLSISVSKYIGIIGFLIYYNIDINYNQRFITNN